jgi:Bacterial Ig domain
MRVSRLSGVALAALIAGLLSPLATANADPQPAGTAAITSPADGTQATGPITVSAEGHLDPNSQDTVSALQLDVGGSPVPGQQVSCVAPPSDLLNCYGSFSYDPTPMGPGSYALQVELLTASGGFVLSSEVHVVVPVPPPTVTLTPVASPVTGPVDISVTGDTNAASPDFPASVDLTWGNTPIGSMACPGTPVHECPLLFHWDSTLSNGTDNLTATMTTAENARVATSLAIEARNPKPTVAITTPADGATRSGVINVTATAAIVGAQNDYPDSMQLYLNDTDHPVEGQQVGCTGAPSCDGSFTWDATGQSGRVDLIVGVHTHRGKTNAAAVTVHVTSPAPKVTIGSPADGATGSGLVTVTATGTVDASQTDSGKSMQLLVNNAPVDTATCPAGKSCPATLTWDGTGVNGSRTLKVLFTTNGGKSASASQTILMTTTPPVASISAPATGSTVSGPVTIVTIGTVNGQQQDSPTSMQLLIDGTPTAAAQPCAGTAAAPRACSLPFGWDTTGLSGPHTLQAKFSTKKGFTALSPITTITVVSPPPTVVITSPAARSTLHRTATVTVTGTVDPSQTDSPSSIRLTLDGAALGGVIPCAPTAAAPRVCNAAYSWSTVGLTGRHTLVATVVSAKGVIGTSSGTSVFVYGGTKTVLVPAKSARAGRPVTYTGRVTTLINRLGAPGVKVKVVMSPARGKPKTVYVRTDVHGYFKVAFKPAVNTTVAATLVTPPYYGSSHTSTKLHVLPSFKCTAGRSVARNRLDQGSCRVTNLPKNTKVTLQYQFLGHWYTLGVGRAPGSVIPFSFRFARSGTYHIRVVLSATSVFAAATGPALKVAVT